MKHIATILLFLLPALAFSQRLPSGFPTKTPEATDAIYTQETGAARKVLFSDLKTWILTGVSASAPDTAVYATLYALGDSIAGIRLEIPDLDSATWATLYALMDTATAIRADFPVNTDAQTLGVDSSGNTRTISISGGNSISFGVGASTGGADSTIYATVYRTDTMAAAIRAEIPINTDSQTLSFASPNLTISGGNTVSLAPLISGLLSGVDSSIFASVYRVDTASAAIRSEIPTNNNQLTNGAGYITGNQPITLSGDVTGSGTTAITTDIANGAVDWAELSTAVQDSIQAGDSRVDTLPTASGIPTHLALFLAERQLGSLNGLRINDTAKMVLLPATWGILAPGGTTAQRWTGAAGALYYNQDVGQYQFHNGTTWNSMSPFTILPSGDLYYNGGNLGINLTSPSFLLDISSTATSSNNLFRLQGVQAGATFSVTATGDELFYNFPVKNRFTFAASTGYIRMDNGGFRWQPAVKVQTINGREVFNVNEYAWGGGGPRYSGIEISNDAYETLTLSGIATSKGRQYATPFLLNLPAGETSGTPSNLAGDYIAAIAIKSDIMGYQGAPTLNLAGILLNPEFLSTDPKGRADTVDNVYGYFYEPIALPSYHSNHYSFYGSSGRMKVANYEFDNEESLTGHDGDALRYNASTGRIALSAASYGSLKKTTATPLYFGPTDTLVTGMTSGVSLNTTLTDSTITVGVAGVYEITYTGTVSLDPTAGGTYLVTFSLYNNSTELGETLSEYEIVASASSNWFGNISGHTVMSLAESDVISLRYSGNTEVPSELRNVSLSVKKL